MTLIEELTSHQLCRLAVCARINAQIAEAFCVLDIVDALEMEPTQIGRFLRAMSLRGYVRRVNPPRNCAQPRAAYYTMTKRWALVRALLRLQGQEPGRCCVCGDENTVPYLWRQRFFCRECLMTANRTDYPMRRG